MADGRETRAKIDSETVRGLLLINGGGAVALLAFLPGVIQKPELEELARAIIWSVFIFQFGLVFAVVYNRLRRLCSLEYSRKELKKCVLFKRQLEQPCVCHWSITFMWASILAFLLAGVIVLLAGLGVLGSLADQATTLTDSNAQHSSVSPHNKALSSTPKSARVLPR